MYKNFTGFESFLIDGNLIDEFHQQEKIPISSLQLDQELYPNTYIELKSLFNPKHTSIGKVSNQHIVKIKEPKVYGIKPRNREQIFALDALLDDNISVVILTGRSGAGKTLMMTSVAVDKRLRKKYKKVVLSKPMSQVGEFEIGILPGGQNEKIAPYLSNFKHNIEYLYPKTTYENIMEELNVEIIPIQFFRGASFIDSFVAIDECFPGEQQVLTEKGSIGLATLYCHFNKKTMKGIQKKKINFNEKVPKILSFNEKTKEFEYKKILAAVCNGKKELIEIKTPIRNIRCTENHPFLTKRGWVNAINLQYGDLLITTEHDKHQSQYIDYTEDQWQVIYGSFLGDGGLSKVGKYTYRINCTHGIDQEEYVKWKTSFLEGNFYFVEKNDYSQKPGISWQTSAFFIKEKMPIGKKTTIPQFILESLNEKGLAIWFMDDGSFNQSENGSTISTDSFNEETIDRIIEILQRKFNLKANKRKAKRENHFFLGFNKEDSLNLIKLIAPYVHPSMNYKIKSFSNIEKYNWIKNNSDYGITPVISVLKTNIVKNVYNLEIEDNNNYIITSRIKNQQNGVIVHNCQVLRVKDILTIGTRIGENSKLILMGDLNQRDTNIRREDTGLYQLINSEMAKRSPLIAMLELQQCERSATAKLFSDIFPNL